MNKITLSGNLVRDVEINQTTSGIKVARFDLAVERRYKNENGEYETDFFKVVAWRGLAEYCEKYLGKGKKVLVNGTLQNRSYDSQDGTKKYVTEVIADEVECLAWEKKEQKLEPIEDEDLPF